MNEGIQITGNSGQVLSTRSVGMNLARRFNAGIRLLPFAASTNTANREALLKNQGVYLQLVRVLVA